MPRHGSFPATRLRRNRQQEWLRRAVAETVLSPADLIWPLFVHEHEASLPVPSMPGVERLSIDGVVKAADEARSLWQQGQALHQADRNGWWYRNVAWNTCDHCEYAGPCLGGVEISRDIAPPSGFEFAPLPETETAAV